MAEDIIQLVTFKLGQEEFGLEILKVHEINRMMSITRIPNAPDFVEGVVNLRGKIIPIVDLRKKLGLETRVSDRSTRIIVVELEGKVLGFIVDSVSEVLRIPRKSIEPAPALAVDTHANFIEGMINLQERLLILLDLKRVIYADGLAEPEASLQGKKVRSRSKAA